MKKTQAELVVIGGGPGGYAAAFYAADKGKKVLLIEQDKRLGGVCLTKGCIPSKSLLHATRLLSEARESGFRGIEFGEPKIDLDKMRAWKESVVNKLAQGVSMIAKQRKVEVMTGRVTFEDDQTLRVETPEGQKWIEFQQAIIAVGSKPSLPKEMDLGNPRVMTSTEALDLPEIPKSLLIIGGGYIGMELGTVYAALGSRITVVEALDTILAGADPDLAAPVKKYAERHFASVRLSTKVVKMATHGQQVKVVLAGSDGKQTEEMFDRVLVSVGRSPNCGDLGLDNTHVKTTERGFIQVDATQRTTSPNIFAIGDVVGGLMLAHKASREARVAVDNITGEPSKFENIIIPAVIFTDPEVAWCGLTESEAKKSNIPHEVVKYPWGASGRALTFDRPDGTTKLIVDPETERILGVGICGVGAGELISEGTLAIEMGATVRDLAEVVHPHPTLSETLMESAELFFNTSTHFTAVKRPTPKEPASV